MKYVNVRQMLSNYEKATESLPVTVTKYGQPIFEIRSIGDEIKDVAVPSQHSVNTIDDYCRVPNCGQPFVGMGTVFNEGEEIEVPMCKKHLFKSLKEA